MLATELLASNLSNIPNFHHLALFICHLFVGGHFRSGHVLYDPNVFDGRLTSEIDSVCSISIPWLTTDITRPSSLPWQSADRTDHILQLIFFDQNRLTDQIDQIKGILTAYHIFVFPSTDEIHINESISKIVEFKPILNLNSLALQYDSKADSINVHWILDGEEKSRASRFDMNTTQNVSLFDETFGKFEKMSTIIVEVECAFEKVDLRQRYLPIKSRLYLANYFAVALNASHLIMSCHDIRNPNSSCIESVVQKQREYGREILLEYEPISDEQSSKSNRGYVSSFQVDSFQVYGSRQWKSYPLYPYSPIDLVAMFFYGKDFQRQRNISSVPSFVKIGISIFITFIAVAAIILYVIRKKFKLRHDSLFPTLVDIIVIFVGGGRIHMRHKLERLFFGILTTVAFFMTSLWLGDLLHYIYQIKDQRISTSDQLAKINSPIYIPADFQHRSDVIYGMLRRKIGPNIRYGGVELFTDLSYNQNDSFVFIEEKKQANLLKVYAEELPDFDILDERLGSLITHHNLESSHYVSEQMLKHLNKAIGGMMENGLHRFYTTYSEFMLQIPKEIGKNGDDDGKAMKVIQLRRVLKLFLYLIALALVIFIVEMVTFYARMLYNN